MCLSGARKVPAMVPVVLSNPTSDAQSGSSTLEDDAIVREVKIVHHTNQRDGKYKKKMIEARKLPASSNDDSGARNGTSNASLEDDTIAREVKMVWNGKYKKQAIMYHPTLIEKAVHLIRSPFDNIVSRFHREQKENKKKKDTAWVQ